MNYVEQFFSELDKKIKQPVKIILTGAMAGIILGNIRPSMDIDFEIEFLSMDNPSDGLVEQIGAAISEVSAQLKLPAQYSDSIQGWSEISFLDYREKSSLYKQIGKVEVRLLSPEHWTIGKMARYLPLDEMDVTFVLKKHNVKWEKIVQVWAEAVKKSRISEKVREFRDHVYDFLKHKGKKIWGDNFDYNLAIEKFKSSAGIKT